MSRAFIAGVILAAGLVTGGMLMQSGAWREARAATGSPRLLEQVIARVRYNYIDSLSADEMYRRAASGLVKETDDPYSVLLTPDRYRRLRETTRGRYAGIGVEVDIRDGFVTVIAPLAGTPAAGAGILPSDRIITIDATPTHGLTMEEVQQALRGPSGTKVRLGLERGATHPALTVTRREIVYHPVQRTRVSNGIAYVELATFSENAAKQLRRSIDSLRERGARSLVLDLRQNPGGLLEQGLAVAELFLNPGQPIASTRGRTPESNEDFDDEATQAWPGMPVVALIDSGSASAAEIVAGALQDNGRAVLVGSRTYGKGSAQSIFPVVGGHALKLTTARWFTPKGRTIDRDSTKGRITPDIDVAAGKRDAAGKAVGVDPVVGRAFALLQGVTTIDELRARVPRRR